MLKAIIEVEPLKKELNYNDFGSKIKYHEILLEFLKDKKIPIMYDFSCSHIQPSTILKIGAVVIVDFENIKIEYQD